MSGIGSSQFSNPAPQKHGHLVIAISWGAFVGALTFAVGAISWISPNPIIGAIQVTLMVLILPGMIGATAFAGNVHAFSLVPGAIINALLHCSICWLLLRIRARLKARANGSAIIALLVIGAALAHAQGTETDAFQNAKHQYQTGQLGEAERGF